MFKHSRIYVAGHTGLLGSALLRKLFEKGFHNILIRTHRELDLADRIAADQLFKQEKPEYVFFAAGKTGNISVCNSYPASFLHENIAMQDNVFEAAQKYGVRHFVFYGSSCVYPKYAPQPIKEETLLSGPLEETSEAYAVAKLAGILACKAYNIQYKTSRFIALIPNTIYGPNDHFSLESSHVFTALIRKFHEAREEDKSEVTLWGSGNPRREFIFSEDVAEASIFMVKNAEKLENTHYNVGVGEDYSVRDLALLIADTVGFHGKINWNLSKPDGAPRKLLDSSRIIRMGWKPSVAVKDGLKKTYEWYLKNIEKGKK